MSAATYRLAPAAVVRAAAWPIEALDPFGDVPELEELAATATRTDPTGWARFAQLHDRTLDAERAALKAATLDDPRFRKALELSNPALAERIARHPTTGERTKWVRGLEATLYRYLARAAGRTEPCDLWAGVALARWGRRTDIRAAPARLRFAPDLRPFQAMLRQVSSSARHRARSRWRANPTLERQPDGRWLFQARQADGSLVRRRLGHDPAADAILRALPSLPPATPSRLSRALAARLQLPDGDVREAIHEMIEAGLLVGGLDLPARFTTPWHALRSAEGLLLGRERAAWRAAVRGLRRVCDELEARYERMEPGAVRHALGTARTLVEGLADAFDVARDRLPRALLRCDLRLPFRVVLGRAERDAVLAALESYDETSESWSPVIALRRASADRLLRSFGPDGPLAGTARDGDGPRPWPLCWSEIGEENAELRARLRRWERLLSAGRDEVVLQDPTARLADRAGTDRPPLGVLIVAPVVRNGRRVPDLVVGGVVDEVAAPYARFAPLFGAGRSAAPPRDPLLSWLRAELGGLGRKHGIDVAELLAPWEANPGILARPSLVRRAVEIWGATVGAASLAGARLYREPATGRFLIRRPGRSRPLAVFWFPAADVARDDPLTRLALQTSFHDTPLGHGAARGLCFDTEVRAPAWSPRVRLACGAIVRPRRTVLAGEALERLARLSGPERYVFWRGLAREHSWPRRVLVRRDGGPALLVPRGSPLALEAACRGLDGDTRLLTIEEDAPAPWLADADGGHHRIEIAVPFARARHGWSPLEGGHGG